MVAPVTRPRPAGRTATSSLRLGRADAQPALRGGLADAGPRPTGGWRLRLWPDAEAARRLLDGRDRRSRPRRRSALVACGDRAVRRAVARLVAYDDAQTVAAAALKLLPLDPVDADRLGARSLRRDVDARRPRRAA